MQNIFKYVFIGFIAAIIVAGCRQHLEYSLTPEPDMAVLEQDNDILSFEDVALEEQSETDNVSVVTFLDEEVNKVVVRSNSVNTKNRAKLIVNLNGDSTKQRLFLAQCLLAEGGWTSRDDWSGIMSVLHNRIQNSPRWRSRTLDELASQYCHALWPSRTHNAWMHNLEWDDMPEPPAGWPQMMSWSQYRGRWNAIRMFVNKAFDGTINVEACPAAHWGSPGDSAPASWDIVDCGRTNNIFYR
jgi:hypothetical protein